MPVMATIGASVMSITFSAFGSLTFLSIGSSPVAEKLASRKSTMQSKKSMNGISGISVIDRAPTAAADLLLHEPERNVVQQPSSGHARSADETGERAFRSWCPQLTAKVTLKAGTFSVLPAQREVALRRVDRVDDGDHVLRTASSCRCAARPDRTSCRSRRGAHRSPSTRRRSSSRDRGSVMSPSSPTGTGLRSTSIVLTTVLPSFQTSWNFRSPRISTWSCFSFGGSFGSSGCGGPGTRASALMRAICDHTAVTSRNATRHSKKVDERNQRDLVIGGALAAVHRLRQCQPWLVLPRAQIIGDADRRRAPPVCDGPLPRRRR